MIKNREKLEGEHGRKMRKRKEPVTGEKITHKRIPQHPLMMRLLN